MVESPSNSDSMLSRILTSLVLCALIGCSPDPQDGSRVALADRFDPVQQSYAFVIPNLEAVEGVGGIRAEDCGTCHETIYAEWAATTHASALKDIQFQSELTKKESPKWICLNCHIPVQNQRKTIITHLEDGDVLKPLGRPNPSFDPAMQQEGVTCAACHVRRDPENGSSFIVGPNGSPNAPHPVRQDAQALRNVCERCHNPQGEGLTRNLICWFDTMNESAAGQTALQEAFGKGGDCVTCHMPETNRHVADTFTNLPTRDTRQHQWVGGGVPKWYDGYDSLLERGYESALGVEVSELPEIVAGQDLALTVLLTNRKAGHFLPTADPERFILALAVLEDEEGTELSRNTTRIGQTWEWNPARKIADNRLEQGETRTWETALPIPQLVQGLRLVVTAYHVRLSTQNARYVAQAEGVDETLLANGNFLVAHVGDHYPFATYVFREVIDLETMERTRSSPEELIALSKLEQGRPFDARDY